jgi:hypothetical protein
MFSFLGKIAWGLLWSRAKSNAARDWAAIPPKVKQWLLIAVAVLILGFVHQIYAHRQAHKQYVAGYAAAQKADQALIDKERAEAVAWKKKADDNNSKIVAEGKARHDETVAHNHALADALRVRIHAASQPIGASRPALPHFAGAAVQPGGPQPQADAGLAGEAATVCVNAEQLIDYAEQADNDHAALETTEDTWKRLQRTWPK